MGKLTDLLRQKGMLEAENDFNPNTPNPPKTDILTLSDQFPEADLVAEVKEKLKACSKIRMSQKRVFEELPTLGEFYIPATMNGRVIECAETSFQLINQQSVVRAKVYFFDGYELRFLFYDPDDKTLQKGKFEEFPRDGFGQTMGHLGIEGNTLCWIKKNFKDV